MKPSKVFNADPFLQPPRGYYQEVRDKLYSTLIKDFKLDHQSALTISQVRGSSPLTAKIHGIKRRTLPFGEIVPEDYDDVLYWKFSEVTGSLDVSQGSRCWHW